MPINSALAQAASNASQEGVAYPFKFTNGQLVEASLQGDEGMFETDGNGRSGGKDYYDQRSAASLIAKGIGAI